jgi:hypothetical protein
VHTRLDDGAGVARRAAPPGGPRRVHGGKSRLRGRAFPESTGLRRVARGNGSLPGLRYLVGVGMPSPVGCLGEVLVMSSPYVPGVAGPVAARVGNDGAAKLSQQLRNGDGDQLQDRGVPVEGTLEGGADREESMS